MLKGVKQAGLEPEDAEVVPIADVAPKTKWFQFADSPLSSLRKDYYIKNEKGENRYRVKQTLLSLTLKFHLLDANTNQELIQVRQKIFAFRPTFVFERNGVDLATMVHRMGVFSNRRFTVKLADDSEIDIVGNIMHSEYLFKLNGEIIARINKRLWSIRDIHTFEVIATVDEQLMLAIVAISKAID